MRTDIDAAVAAVASQQQSSFSRSQAMACGATDSLIRRRLQSGRWTHEAVGVYGWPGAVDTYARRLWISYLSVGTHAVVSHESAAALHRLTGFPAGPLVLTVPHSGYHRIPGVTVHQISDLTPSSCIEVGGLPVTGVARTLADLVTVTRSGRLAAALDDAVVSKRLTTFGAVGQEAASIARRGKPHLGVLLHLLDERGPGKEPPQSKLELSMFLLIQRHGLPEPRRQFSFPGRTFTRSCVDAAYPEIKLILEADGRRWHTRIADLARDHLRDAEATRAGWSTLRLLHEAIVDEPEWTAGLIADTIATRASQLGLTSMSSQPETNR